VGRLEHRLDRGHLPEHVPQGAGDRERAGPDRPPPRPGLPEAGEEEGVPHGVLPSSFFTQDIILYSGLDRIDFVTSVEWWEEKTMLKVAFPLAVEDTSATYEIPFGTIRRSTQLRNSWRRRAWRCPPPAGPTSPPPPTGEPDQHGKVRLRYQGEDDPSLPPPLSEMARSAGRPGGSGDRVFSLPPCRTWSSAQTVQRGYETNVPLIVTTIGKHGGPLPPTVSFVRLTGAGCVLTSIKKAEGGPTG